MTVIVPKRLQERLKEGPIHGGVYTVEELPDGRRVGKMIPQKKAALVRTHQGTMDWNDASDAHGVKTEIPAEEVARLKAALPPTIRSTAREKYQELIGRLYKDAETQFKMLGEIRWPASIRRELDILGVAQGTPHLSRQVEALATKFIQKGAREQQAADAKSVTRSWHGHLSA